MLLDSKVAIVTGAGSGIGHAIAVLTCLRCKVACRRPASLRSGNSATGRPVSSC